MGRLDENLYNNEVNGTIDIEHINVSEENVKIIYDVVIKEDSHFGVT